MRHDELSLFLERSVELLTLCQKLQSEKDGVDRPDPGVIDKTKTLDKFAQDVVKCITYMRVLHQLLPMGSCLVELGQKLEKQGKIAVEYGDDYGQAALSYVLEEHGLHWTAENEMAVGIANE